MNGDIAVFIPIVAIAATAWVIINALRLRRDRDAGASERQRLSDAQENGRLTRENEELRRNVESLEERLQVLERIATDPAERTAREIERLR